MFHSVGERNEVAVIFPLCCLLRIQHRATPRISSHQCFGQAHKHEQVGLLLYSHRIRMLAHHLRRIPFFFVCGWKYSKWYWMMNSISHVRVPDIKIIKNALTSIVKVVAHCVRLSYSYNLFCMNSGSMYAASRFIFYKKNRLRLTTYINILFLCSFFCDHWGVTVLISAFFVICVVQSPTVAWHVELFQCQLNECVQFASSSISFGFSKFFAADHFSSPAENRKLDSSQ